jgi:hypothetical protein
MPAGPSQHFDPLGVDQRDEIAAVTVVRQAVDIAVGREAAYFCKPNSRFGHRAITRDGY